MTSIKKDLADLQHKKMSLNSHNPCKCEKKPRSSRFVNQGDDHSRPIRSMGLVHLPTNLPSKSTIHVPICSMYGLFTYMWLIFMVNVGKYTILYMDPMG